MIYKWHIGDKHQSTVSDWKKLLTDFRDQFPYDPLTALIVETFANSLDAKATEIDILVREGNFQIIDNGKGMNSYQFEEYHNIASLTKRKGEGIGFAGVGAKIFLDKATRIITETKSNEFYGASSWAFNGKVPEWEFIETRNLIPYKSGTFVNVELKEERDKEKLTPDFVKEVLYQFYNAVLLGYYTVREIKINGKVVEPWKPANEDIEIKKEVKIKVGRHEIPCVFIKTKQNLPEYFQGLSIVVYGKTVTQEWFKQYPINAERITGLILADYLIEILRTSKSDFDRTAMLWKYFHNRVGNFIGAWLEEIGEKPKPPTISHDINTLSRKVESTINDLLKWQNLEI